MSKLLPPFDPYPRINLANLGDLLCVQVKKQEIRGMLTDVDKEGAASVSFNDFVEMVTPKVLARDPKVSRAATLSPTRSKSIFVLERRPY